jgi:hypothetical protein
MDSNVLRKTTEFTLAFEFLRPVPQEVSGKSCYFPKAFVEVPFDIVVPNGNRVVRCRWSHCRL